MIRNIAILLGIFFLQFSVNAQSELPQPSNPPKLVNDRANLLSGAQERQLESKLLAYNDSTSTQVVILTVDTYQGYESVDFSQRVAENWGIGQKGKDNGILITVAKSDRKMAIVTGYGMESRVTDAATASIRENYMKPAFQEGDFYKGLDEATSIIFDLAAGKYKADKIAKNKNTSKGIGLGAFLIFFFILISVISRIRRVRNHHIGGGDLNFVTLMLLLMGSGRGHGGSWNDFNSGGGGFGGGGGGFGGFGGGSFGGGGSGGSW